MKQRAFALLDVFSLSGYRRWQRKRFKLLRERGVPALQSAATEFMASRRLAEAMRADAFCSHLPALR